MKKFIFVIVATIILLGAGFFVWQNLLGPFREPVPASTSSSETGKSISAPANVNLGKIPESAEIVYHDENGYIYVMDRNSGNSTQITFDPITNLEHAAISPDRRYIIANENPSDPSLMKLWLFNLERGTKARLLPNFYSAGPGGVDWDPQGFIYFAGQPTKESGSDVYKVKPDGTGLTRLTHIITSRTSVINYASDVSVSADGSMVAYVGGAPRKLGNEYVAKTQIWVMNATGTNQRMVFDGGLKLGMYAQFPIGAFDPEISNDNKSVVFSLVNTDVPPNWPDTPGMNTAHDLWRINLDGSGLTRLTKPGPISIVPDWKGNTIIYTELNGQDKYKGASMVSANGTDQLPARIKAGTWMMKLIPEK